MLRFFTDQILRLPRYWIRLLRRSEVVRHFGVLLGFAEIREPITWRYLLRGRYERGEARCLLAGVRAGDRVLEVGGGIGFTSALAARLAGPDNVHCFEANPDLIDRIRQTHARNGVGPEVVNAVLGERAGQVDFNKAEGFLFSSTHEVASSRDRVSVSVLDVNAEIARTRSNALVMDVEGGERELVPIIDWRPIETLILELHPDVIGAQACSDVIDHLQAQGFRTARMSSTRNKQLLRRARSS